LHLTLAPSSSCSDNRRQYVNRHDDDQHTLEAFYRIQVWKEIAVTPDIQYIRNPALNPNDDTLWVFGLRVRLAF
jgi:carbohydrate-selective porin OprB